jgi:hypothetical protein
LNAGRKIYGDIQSILSKYKTRGFNVKRHHLEYQMELREKDLDFRSKCLLLEVHTIPTGMTLNNTVVSDLTDLVTLEIVNVENKESIQEVEIVKNERWTCKRIQLKIN